MKLIPIIVLLSIIASPIVYKHLKTYFYPFTLLRDFKRDKIPTIMVQMILDKMGDKKVSELRNIKIVHNQETGVKHYYIEAFVLDTTTHKKWNNPEAVFLFHINDNNGKFEYQEHYPRHVWDIGKLIGEDTNALLQMSPSVPNIVREDIGKTRFATKEKHYQDIRQCEATASKAIMCKETVLKTKDLKSPIFQTRGNNDNVRNEWQSTKRNIDSKYDCEFMVGEYSATRHPYEVTPFSCRQRYDLDTNPNRANVDESTKNVTQPLLACNNLVYTK